MKTTGITLIVIGLLLTIFTSFSFFTKKADEIIGQHFRIFLPVEVKGTAS